MYVFGFTICQGQDDCDLNVMTTTAYLYIYTNTPFYSLVLQPSEPQHGSTV